ncbi:hypothetical protein [Methanobrevibacter sp.]|uniref:hypothetical protein n=1 Tax=Methanobrevibacter sp. TaxID=66852 RepID=UPI0025EC1B7B|nr:hypothetical protein [Methanobrevibacter sp.]MBQ2961549.1 hypothetical protein [Methanobrevibacter sp.]
MKFNRIAIIAILAIFAVVLAGSASAFDLGFLTGSDSEPQEVTVGGIDFSIPAGFTENEQYKMVNEKAESSSIDYYMSSAGYEDDTKANAIYILVGDYGDYNVTNDIIEYVLESEDYEKKTINGHDGYLVQQTATDSSDMMDVEQPIYMFVYEENGDLVYLGATQESYFSDIIIE